MRVGPKSSTKYPYKRRKTQVEAETGVMQPQAKGCLEPLVAKGVKEGFSPRGGITLLTL